MSDSPAQAKLENSPLTWLADAPLFLDADQVTAFYDAIIRPEFESGVITLSRSEAEGKKSSFEGGVGAEVTLSALVKKIFPFLDAKASISGKGRREKSASETASDAIELREISTPQRQLIQLALHYVADLPERLVLPRNGAEQAWANDDYARMLPRALVFVELPANTIIIPAAAELNEGRVITFFDKLIPALSSKNQTIPRDFPADTEGSEAERANWRAEYWRWYTDNFDSHKAMSVVESAIFESRGRVRWIDFRVFPAGGLPTVQLHMAGREQYDTGVFAYNFIRRGYRHGLRVIGTLKSGPDLNVLAVFER